MTSQIERVDDQIPIMWWKFGENRFSRFWDRFAKRFI